MTPAIAIGFGVPALIAIAIIWLGRGRSETALVRSVATAAIPGLAAAMLAVVYIDTVPAAAEYYSKNLRASLFSGFLSLGGFLLSLKTFIVVKMKEGLYDHALYRERLESARKLHPTKKIPFYDSLERLRSLLLWSIISALSTAVAQLTFGLFTAEWCFTVAIAFAGLSLGFLAQALYNINRNLRRWFELLEKDAETKRAKELEAAAAAAAAKEKEEEKERDAAAAEQARANAASAAS